MNNYNELIQCLDGLKYIPKKEERKRTLLDIMGIEHLETHWSQIYAYFFDSQEDHGMGRLFVKALLKTCGIDEDFLNNPYVRTEHLCNDGKRIDILLIEGNHAVIIENKVNHILDNDLNSYYEEIKKTYKCSYVKVVVLALNKYNLKNYKVGKIPCSDRFSITHKALMQNMYHVFKENEDKEQWNFNYLFNEFYQNIKNMENEINKEELKFFSERNLEERSKISKIAKIYNDLVLYLDEAMKCDNINIDTIKSVRHERDYVKYFFKGTNDNMMLTLFYKNKLLNPDPDYPHPHILIVLELQGDYMSRINQFDFSSYFGDKIKHSNASGRHWMHFASYVENIDNIEETLPQLKNKIPEIIKGSGLIELAEAIKGKMEK